MWLGTPPVATKRSKKRRYNNGLRRPAIRLPLAGFARATRLDRLAFNLRFFWRRAISAFRQVLEPSTRSIWSWRKCRSETERATTKWCCGTRTLETTTLLLVAEESDVPAEELGDLGTGPFRAHRRPRGAGVRGDCRSAVFWRQLDR